MINFFKGVKEEEEAPPENGLTADEQGQLSLKARRLGAKRGDHSGFVDEERKERNRPKPVNPDEDDPTKAPSGGWLLLLLRLSGSLACFRIQHSAHLAN